MLRSKDGTAESEMKMLYVERSDIWHLPDTAKDNMITSWGGCMGEIVYLMSRQYGNDLLIFWAGCVGRICLLYKPYF